jgi:hypothetical protein
VRCEKFDWWGENLLREKAVIFPQLIEGPEENEAQIKSRVVTTDVALFCGKTQMLGEAPRAKSVER